MYPCNYYIKRKRLIQFSIMVLVLIAIMSQLYILLNFLNCVNVTDKEGFYFICCLTVIFCLCIAGIAIAYVKYTQQNVVDPKTGLYTGLKLGRDMKKIEKTLKHCYIVAMDMDELKKVNDTYGHDAGDQLILSFANKLRKLAKANKNVNAYRRNISGDEFVVIVYGNTFEYQNFENQLKKILDSTIELKIDAQNQLITLQVKVSFGTQRYIAGSISDAYNQADSLMYENKRKRKSV